MYILFITILFFLLLFSPKLSSDLPNCFIRPIMYVPVSSPPALCTFMPTEALHLRGPHLLVLHYRPVAA